MGQNKLGPFSRNPWHFIPKKDFFFLLKPLLFRTLLKPYNFIRPKTYFLTILGLLSYGFQISVISACDIIYTRFERLERGCLSWLCYNTPWFIPVRDPVHSIHYRATLQRHVLIYHQVHFLIRSAESLLTLLQTRKNYQSYNTIAIVYREECFSVSIVSLQGQIQDFCVGALVCIVGGECTLIEVDLAHCISSNEIWNFSNCNFLIKFFRKYSAREQLS